MYFERLDLLNVRTFKRETLEFIHPDRQFQVRKDPEGAASALLPRPRLPNVSLLVGDNGSGKSTVLRMLAMTALGPSFADANLPTQGLVRRGPADVVKGKGFDRSQSYIIGQVFLHDQDRHPG